MTQDRMRILGMLSEGKITAEEADLLLGSIDSGAGDAAPAPAAAESPSAGWPTGPSATGTPKFMYVKVYGGKDTVDVKVPLGLLRTGLKLTSLIPPQAMDKITESMDAQGMSFDLNNIKPEDIEEIIESLREMEVNVVSGDGDHIRVFCA